MARNFQPKLVI